MVRSARLLVRVGHGLTNTTTLVEPRRFYRKWLINEQMRMREVSLKLLASSVKFRIHWRIKAPWTHEEWVKRNTEEVQHLISMEQKKQWGWGRSEGQGWCLEQVSEREPMAAEEHVIVVDHTIIRTPTGGRQTARSPPFISFKPNTAVC